LLFGGITILFFITIGVIVYLAITQGTGQFRSGILIPLCGVPLVFIVIIYIAANFTFRRFGQPMADIFLAIDSIADGNLSVRVPEDYPREFGQLARRFNRMVSELERAETQRRNLTADIAHELRTPLHIIQGNLEGIMDGVYDATPEQITNTLDETKLLARLVNDLQTLSLAEAGQLPLHPTRFRLADLMNNLTSSFSASTSALGIDLKTDISDPSKEISADYDRLDQVLSNLISNSIRHTPQGGAITIRADSTSKGTRITLHDTGSGISAEDLPFIFDRFWRRDRSRTERFHSGLGLAIAKQLVHAHGGTITAESGTGKGTTFTIEL
jgi:two-component system OmpR family sensor kinase/two-component system sensor histidine kinase BaeS